VPLIEQENSRVPINMLSVLSCELLKERTWVRWPRYLSIEFKPPKVYQGTGRKERTSEVAIGTPIYAKSGNGVLHIFGYLLEQNP
jgi:hypothetical protein